jgi:hypothetical protein
VAARAREEETLSEPESSGDDEEEDEGEEGGERTPPPPRLLFTPLKTSPRLETFLANKRGSLLVRTGQNSPKRELMHLPVHRHSLVLC